MAAHRRGVDPWPQTILLRATASPRPNNCLLSRQQTSPFQQPSPFCHPEQVKRGMNWDTSGPLDTRVPYPGNGPFPSTTLSFLPSRLERTRISCHVALETTGCAAFRKESRMKFANATNINRKSGVAEGRDLQCASTPPRFPRATPPLIPTEPISPRRHCSISGHILFIKSEAEGSAVRHSGAHIYRSTTTFPLFIPGRG